MRATTPKPSILTLILTLFVLVGAFPLSAAEVTRIPLDQVVGPAAAGARLRPDTVRGATDKATFSIQYDDGEADNGYGPAPDTGVTFYDIAMVFDLPQTNLKVETVEVCLSRLGADNSLDFDLTFWRADGPGGAPGTLIQAFNANASNITTDLAGTYFTYNISPFDFHLPSETVYIGIGWDATVEEEFFVCSDYDRSTVQPAYSSFNQSGTWNTPPAQDGEYTALMFRGVFSDGATGPSTCVPSATTLCLNDGRFQVDVTWRTPQGATGQGQAVQLTNDTGYYWFFNPDNVEMVIKVLNGCGTNNHYWVFAGGLTNVEVRMTVTDTQTGFSRPYVNPLRTPFQPIQDTSAFATCP